MSCSNRRLWPSSVLKLSWCLTNTGLANTLHLIRSRLGGTFRAGSTKTAAAGAPTIPGDCQEVLNLRPGEYVQVRSEQEIRSTLDNSGRHRGLLWMPDMARFCGTRHRVYRRVERLVLESTGQIRTLNNTVLLEGVMCEDFYGCDRSCFHFWREAWLQRVT